MTHNWKRWMAPGAALTAAALLAACSSSSSSSSSSAPAASASTSTSASAPASSSATASSSSAPGVAAAQAAVAQFEATTTNYPVPTASISGVSALKGKTVYYIPLVAAIPGFVVTAATMKTALAAAGLKLQVCDAQGQPSGLASCVQQATTAGAAGIVTDAVPYAMAQNAFDAAKAKGIPIIITDQIPPSANTANTDQVTYVPGVVNQPSQIFDWVVANSGGKANFIIAEESDSPSSIAYVTNGLSILKACTGCTYTIKQITATTNNQLASDTAANLLANPSATYYYTEFEDSLDPTVQGLQQANKNSIALEVAGGSTDGLGRLAGGNSPVKAVVAVDQAYAGWALTDEILRLATKSAPVTETFPSRLFTADNISTITVNAANQASGAWFGNDSYQAAFKQLWGI
jgi:ribose transport system substrate-binding protein